MFCLYQGFVNDVRTKDGGPWLNRRPFCFHLFYFRNLNFSKVRLRPFSPFFQFYFIVIIFLVLPLYAFRVCFFSIFRGLKPWRQSRPLQRTWEIQNRRDRHFVRTVAWPNCIPNFNWVHFAQVSRTYVSARHWPSIIVILCTFTELTENIPLRKEVTGTGDLQGRFLWFRTCGRRTWWRTPIQASLVRTLYSITEVGPFSSERHVLRLRGSSPKESPFRLSHTC